ncbi:hypothetical protein HanRHA438_Chr13g0599651 [Helianthus annuus]|nr:hypothetical protein HanRHA438_Chr13g0599651 [Helianthus annuus]
MYIFMLPLYLRQAISITIIHGIKLEDPSPPQSFSLHSHRPSLFLPVFCSSSSQTLCLSSTTMASSSNDSTFSMNTLMHMISIKLSSTNYLYWRSQIKPILSCQGLLGHADGTIAPPSAEITRGDKTVSNPDFTEWLANDQKAVMILNASLSEEAIAEVIGVNDSRSMWLALESAFCNTSIERVHHLRDQLRQSTKGSATVSEYGRKFKFLCDQLAAVGQPVE